MVRAHRSESSLTTAIITPHVADGYRYSIRNFTCTISGHCLIMRASCDTCHEEGFPGTAFRSCSRQATGQTSAQDSAAVTEYSTPLAV